MRAYFVEADWAPKPGYKLTEKEQRDHMAYRGGSIWKNIRGAVTDRPEPVPTAEQVKVRVGAAGICGTDMHLIVQDDEGYTKFDGHTRYPIITGHEFSGEVVEVGKDVETLQVGDLVTVESMHWCGKCPSCRTGMFNQCRDVEEPGLTYDGGFAEYATVNEKYCYKLNDIAAQCGDRMLALEMGAMFEPVGVAYNGLFVQGGIMRPGGNVAVFGAGPIGLSAIGLMRTSGAGKIFCFETVDSRHDMARAMGADVVLNPIKLQQDGIDAADLLLEQTDGRGISLFAECSAATNAVYPTIQGALAIGAKVSQIGITGNQTSVDFMRFQQKAAYISASIGQSGQGIYMDVINLIANGRMDISKMVAARVPLEQMDEALQIARTDAGKVLVSARYNSITK